MYKLVVLLFVLCGCVKTEILNSKLDVSVNTLSIRDTMEVEPPDTMDKVPIGFNPSINNWDDIDIDINL